MLIIFDLDDTLIDTSGCITYYKLEEALRVMQSEGLELPDFEAALALLRRLDQVSSSAAEGLSECLELLGADPRFLEIGLRVVYETGVADLPVVPLEGAVDVLSELSLTHQMALVSNGKESLQKEKMKKAGIDSAFFSKIAISEEKDKAPRYQTVVEGLNVSAHEVMVCGDRVAVDLSPAKALGFKTVHVQWGRGLRGEKQEDVDHVVSSLREIPKLI